MVISGHRVLHDGRAWYVAAVEADCVHLVNGDEGVCVACDDPVLLAAIDALPRLP